MKEERISRGGAEARRDDVARLSLSQLDGLIARRQPIGFAISREIYEQLRGKFIPSACGSGLGGIPFVVDDALAPEEIDVAFTDRAWSERLLRVSASPRENVSCGTTGVGSAPSTASRSPSPAEAGEEEGRQ